MANLKVIIADDVQDIHTSLKETLKKRFKYIECKSFYAILPLLKFLKIHRDEYDILILDNQFDDSGSLTGKNALPKIREYAPDLPIIFLTGKKEYEYFAGIENYNVRFLNKPASQAEIYFAINETIKTRKSFSEMRTELKEFQDELSNTRKWATDVLKLQDINVEINENDIGDDEKWSKYQSKVLSIVEKMKEEEMRKSGKQQFEMIKNKLMDKYSKFEESDINFFATGEFLWQNYRDQLVDFSPILISYSKFIEGVLRKFLVRRRVITQLEDSMLKQSINELKTHPFVFGSDKKKLVNELTGRLKDFAEYRNKAAHPEGVSSDMLEAAKNLLFAVSSGEMFSMLEIIHLYY